MPRLAANDPRCQSGPVLEAAPGEVRISFSEPVKLLGTGIRVVAPSGKRADRPPAVADEAEASVPIAAAEEGTYVVEWQVMSADTHPARGQFTFSVGQASRPAVGAEGLSVGQVAPVGLALQALARWLHFGGYALAFGTLVFSLLPALTASAAIAQRRVARLRNVGIVLLLLAEPLALLGQTGSLGLDQMFDADTMGDTLASSFGRLLGFRLAGALLLWVVLGGSEQPSRPGRWNLPVAAATGLAIGLALVDGLGAHAASLQP
ncbi:MAG TPA: copper resistance CopC family protein, partial [Chloroflexota bacterium]|nr:copper resistance CopC family protein [Chloroflexota bacterium]